MCTNANTVVMATVKRCCVGQGDEKCVQCKHKKDGPYCVPQCPKSKYADENNVCQACHDNCDTEKGCTGPRNTIGPDACLSCAIAVISDDGLNVTKCLPPDTNSRCDDGFYMTTLPTLPVRPMAGKKVGAGMGEGVEEWGGRKVGDGERGL